MVLPQGYFAFAFPFARNTVPLAISVLNSLTFLSSYLKVIVAVKPFSGFPDSPSFHTFYSPYSTFFFSLALNTIQNTLFYLFALLIVFYPHYNVNFIKSGIWGSFPPIFLPIA